MIMRTDGEDGFRPLAGLTPWDQRELRALMDEVAKEYPPESDEEVVFWWWATTVVERWMERGKAVPAKLVLAYVEMQDERHRCVRVAESFGEQIAMIPEDRRREVAREVLDFIAERHREEGEPVPMWVPMAREIIWPESREGRESWRTK